MNRLKRKIISFHKNQVAFLILRVAIITRSLRLAAFVLQKVGWYITPQDTTGIKARVLCLGRTIFVDDVKAMAQYSGRIEYFVIHLKYLHAILNYFFGKNYGDKITESDYHISDKLIEEKKKLEKFFDALLPYLQKRIQFQAILSGNFSYVQQQELSRAALAKNIPFIVLHKEGMLTFVEDPEKSYCRDCHFIGSKILFYNNVIQDYLLNMNLFGMHKEKMRVVGIPRMDYYPRAQTPNSDKKQITLFTVDGPTYFTYLMDDKQKYDTVLERICEFYRYAIEFAAKHPDTDVVIKTKSAKFYSDQINEIKERYFSGQHIPNLIITNSADPKQLILHSDAVLSYNSTTLIEAVLAGKMVITPNLSDIIPNDHRNYFAKYPELAHPVHSFDELENFLMNEKTCKNADEARRQAFLHDMVHNPDGSASKRAEDEILEGIAQQKQNVKVLGIIGARSGSKGVLDKNIRTLAGKPLMAWIIDAAKNSKYIDRVVVSTDSSEYAAIAKEYGAEVPVLRPKQISQDYSTDIEYIKHILDWLKENEGYEPDIVLRLLPTVPLQEPQDIDNGIEALLNDSNADSSVVVAQSRQHPVKALKVSENQKYITSYFSERGKDVTPGVRQNHPMAFHRGNVVISRVDAIRKKNSLTGDTVCYHIVPQHRAFDIDTETDFFLAEQLMKKFKQF